MSAERRANPDSDSSGPPAWIVSFTDMVTLLLAFFVLLQVFARDRDPELFFVGQGSFIRAISSFGLPKWLEGKEDRPQDEHRNVKHPTDSDDEKHRRNRIIDADDERIRQLFVEIKTELDTAVSDPPSREVHVTKTPIAFEASDATLDEAAKGELDRFARELRQNLQASGIELYVVGMAPDCPAGAGRWTVSARRAQAVESYLGAALREEIQAGQARLHWLGAGAGGRWRLRSDLTPEQSFIYLAIIRSEGQHGR